MRSVENVEQAPVLSSALSIEEDELGLDEIILEGEFDLEAFFSEGSEEAASGHVSSNFLLELEKDAQESVQTVTEKVTVDTFQAGVELSSGVFSALGSFLGACGPLCLHGVGSLSPSLATSSNILPNTFSNFSVPGLDIQEDGSFRLEGNVQDLAQATGLSREDILSGKYSSLDILSLLFTAFCSEGLSMVFGFGLVDAVLDSILPG